jgi:hypothetical protein
MIYVFVHGFAAMSFAAFWCNTSFTFNTPFISTARALTFMKDPMTVDLLE